MQLHRKNHYIPQYFIRNWSRDKKTVFVYQVIVSNKQVPYFQKKSIKEFAYYNNLYTDVQGGKECDDIEKWIEREYEGPAKKVFDKIHNGQKLTKEDHNLITKYVLLQSIRTPAFFEKNYNRWCNDMKLVFNEIKVPEEVELYKKFQTRGHVGDKHLTISTERITKKNEEYIKVEADIGRGFWLFCIKHIMNYTIKLLPDYKWSILQAPMNISWPLSDNPVLNLSYRSINEYNLNGGWGIENSEIIMPITPSFAIYTKVGTNYPSHINPSIMNANMIKKFMLENASLFIISVSKDESIISIRPRIIDNKIYNDIQQRWLKWGETQKEIDGKYKK